MTQWLSTIELGSLFGTDPYGVLAGLERLRLAEGSQPSALAERHELASQGAGDTGSLETLWHPDVVELLQGTGLELAGQPQRFVTSALFDESDFLEAESGVEADDMPEKPVGRPRGGFDRVIATDGACSGNPGPGGWAWVEQTTGARDSGGATRTTNNVMELTALVQALEYVGPECSLLIRCDSQYVINTVTKWAPNWRRKGWKKADGKPVKNRELVEELLTAYEARTGTTEVEWVKGHAGDAANELCDSLAVAQSRKFAGRKG
ncbi:MAG: ribonuclease H family protein [Ancrocorticia sp.]|uniref:ribonuclease H family protein n=1 Tax=Ancrocorticia sp. TaxID=2593684 RepID=UPI003F916C6F